MRTRNAALLLGSLLLIATGCNDRILEPAGPSFHHAPGHAGSGGGKGGDGGEAYHVVTLGTLGGSNSNAWALNGAGVVVGDSRNADGQGRAFVWTESEGMRDLLGSAHDARSTALGVSDAGKVTGMMGHEDGQGFVFDLATQQVAWLPGLPGHTGTLAWTSNTDGLVVGRSVGTFESGETDWQAVVWIPAADGGYGVPIELGCPTNPIYPAINAAGSLVLNECRGSLSLPRMWARSGDGYGSPVTLGTLGGWAMATAIDDRGRIAGYSTTPSGARRAVIWHPDDYATPIDLGDAVLVIGMNNRNEIVGDRSVKNRRTAAVWTVDDAGNLVTVHNLPAPDGYRETFASGINDEGWIAGSAQSNNGRIAVLWRP
jgi:probable HAF family extracellular repeat protein